MNKQRALMISVAHFVWAVGLCLGTYYVEYGIINICMQWGVGAVAAVNVVAGILLFAVFYFMEKKMLEQELTKTILFIFASYVLPFAYQWMMLVRINEMYAQDDRSGLMLTIMFTFSCLLLGVALFFRAAAALYIFLKAKIKEGK